MNKTVELALTALAAGLAVAAVNLPDPYSWICAAVIASLAAIGIKSTVR